MEEIIIFEEGREENSQMAVVNRQFFLETLEIFQDKFEFLREIIDCAEEATEISWEEGNTVLYFKYKICKELKESTTKMEVKEETMKVITSFFLIR